MADSILALQSLPELESLELGPIAYEQQEVDGGSCTVCSHTCCCTAHEA